MEWNTSELPVSPGKKAKAIEMPFGQVQDSGGPKEPCIRWGPDPPWEGNFEGAKGRPIVKNRDTLWSSVQNG